MNNKDQRKAPVLRFKDFTDDWEQRKLKDEYQKISNAFVGTASPFYVEHGHFYLESNNIKNGQINHDHEVFINDTFYNEQRNKHLHTNDLVMVQSGHVGDSAVITKRYNNIAAHALIMFQNPKYSGTSRFLNYYFQSYNAKKKISVISIGNTISHILASDMNKFITSFPKSSEQQKIATIFQRIQDLISLQQRKINELMTLKETCLSELFPNKKEISPKLRFCKFSNTWKKRKFNSFVHRVSNNNNEKFPNVTYDDIDSKNNILNKKPEQLSTGKHGILFQKNDILYGKLRPYLNNIIKADFKGIAVGDFWVLRADGDPNFLLSLINTSQYKYVTSISAGSKMPRADWKLVSQYHFYIPNNDEQRQIGNTISKLSALILSERKNMLLLKQIKQFLLQNLFI